MSLIVGHSQAKYFHQYIKDDNITTLSYPKYRIHQLWPRIQDIVQSFNVSILFSTKRSLCLSVCLPIYLSIYLSVRPSVCQPVCMYMYLSVRPSVCMYVCISIYLSIFFFFFFLIWVLRPFQEYFTYIEPIVHRRWAKTGEPGEKPPDHP